LPKGQKWQYGCKNIELKGESDNPAGIAIAFMPDVHFHDVFAEFENSIEVETVILEEVPNFDVLFPHYLVEWEYLQQ